MSFTFLHQAEENKVKILSFDEFFGIVKKTDKIFTLIDSWRFIDKEFLGRLPQKKCLIAEKPFEIESNIKWVGCFDISNYMHDIKSYDCSTIWDMRFIYSGDNPLLLFNLLDDYYSDDGLIFSEFQMQTYQTILSIDKSKYNWIAMYDGNDHDKPIVFFDNTNDSDMRVIQNRLNNIE